LSQVKSSQTRQEVILPSRDSTFGVAATLIPTHTIPFVTIDIQTRADLGSLTSQSNVNDTVIPRSSYKGRYPCERDGSFIADNSLQT
jgi:hypothetical protein